MKKPRIFKMLLCAALSFALMIGVSRGLYEASALSRMGSRGAEVREIQTRLINWGYMAGKADGIFGTKTKAGVEYFQRKNGLAVDGVAGKGRWLRLASTPPLPRPEAHPPPTTICWPASSPPRPGASHTTARSP